ncbi:hypothetical protein [Sporosarcina jiandibaonis]|uniref:hypothetical protein n=1 Tax=Sporosarcina jiandibaonis TaxID=2715535 RepID=UPI00155247FA|nr:hypothetical protein [Sporosarcina jiandibaonis]
MVWGTILLSLVGLFILYVVIFTAVKDGIDKSVVGQLIKTKYEVKDEIVTVSDDEIEKELEGEFNKADDK